QMHALVRFHENATATQVTNAADLDEVLRLASEEARRRGMLNVIFIEAKNANTLSMVVDGEETVLGFTYGHGNPPYYESRGAVDGVYPLMTCYASFSHHAEFPRRCVIPLATGVR